jgi:release factor glutamine methyltransferase
VNEPQLVAALRSAGCVFAEEEAHLLVEEASSDAELMTWAARRMAGEPLEYVVGWASFAGLRVAVDPGVFVPRRRSELLVDLATRAPAAVVVDLCCGSGALGAAVATRLPLAEVWAADSDPAAVACARRNLPPERVRQGDLYDALPADLRGRVDLLLVNAPYVPTGEVATMPREARDHEHRVALDGGADGLDALRAVVSRAREHLNEAGLLLLEHGHDQRAALVELAGPLGWRVLAAHTDLAGHARVLVLARAENPRPGGAERSFGAGAPQAPDNTPRNVRALKSGRK